MTTTTTSSTTSIQVEYDVDLESFAIIGDSYVPVQGTSSGSVTLTLNSSDYTYSTSGVTYSSVFVLNASGEISVVNSLTSGTYPSVATSDIVLGYLNFIVASGSFASQSLSVTDVNIDTNGFVDYTFGTQSGRDYYISEVSTGKIQVEFIDTANTPSVSNYTQYRRFKLFNRLTSLIDSPNKNKMSILLDPTTYEKYSLENIEISDIVYSTTQNKSFTLSGFGTTDLTYIKQGFFTLYTEDTEFLLGKEGVVTKNETADADYGVVSKYSNFYTNHKYIQT
jgi:hypothetical protein